MNPSLSERTRVKGGAGQGGDKGRGEGAGRSHTNENSAGREHTAFPRLLQPSENRWDKTIQKYKHIFFALQKHVR